jgi:hypothetical protein
MLEIAQCRGRGRAESGVGVAAPLTRRAPVVRALAERLAAQPPGQRWVLTNTLPVLEGSSGRTFPCAPAITTFAQAIGLRSLGRTPLTSDHYSERFHSSRRTAFAVVIASLFARTHAPFAHANVLRLLSCMRRRACVWWSKRRRGWTNGRSTVDAISTLLTPPS